MPSFPEPRSWNGDVEDWPSVGDECRCGTREYPRFDPQCRLHGDLADEDEPESELEDIA